MYRHVIKKIGRAGRLYSTANEGEVKKFKEWATDWWSLEGPSKPLHSMNKLRVAFVRNGLTQINIEGEASPTKPLKDLKILDVGCGGGILCEPLCRLGAKVTGVDVNKELIQVAKVHSKALNLNITYETALVEEHAEKHYNTYDAVVASEIIEHVNEKENFIKACVNCLKPNGSIFVTTMNKSYMMYICGIVLAENLFKIVPENTHHYEMLVEPHKLERILLDNNCKTICINGMGYNFLNDSWMWLNNHKLNYALHAVKLECN